ncbi:CHAT domain-containing protein [Mycena rosella]|uniref:CHAT domain-containing protein n=1 Tax=Mycena rosella TaxID=1033263 RepID=A0AAD7CXK3_MYCRO|nr:CHAT domain-containing protein [Mycena rosella]
MYLQSLAASLTARYQQLGGLVDLESAVQRRQEIMDLTPEDHPNRVHILHNLAASFHDRYRRLGNLKDLEAAMQHLQEVVNLTPADHISRAHYLQSLALSFRDRYQRLGYLQDLELAVETDQEAVELTPEGHPDRAETQAASATSLRDRYRRLNNLEDLNAAVNRFQKAVNLTPADHPDRATYLQGLGVSFADRYQRLGGLMDLEAALQSKKEAADLTPAGHPDKPGCLQSLAFSFRDRYQRLGNIQDLTVAVQTDQEAVHLTPPDHPDKPSHLQSLASSLRERYQRLGELKDLEEVVQRAQEALALTPKEHLARGELLSILGMSLQQRYRRVGDLEDLEAAVQQKQGALDIAPVDHPARPQLLQSLAVSFTDRYQQLGDLKDLVSAVQGFQEAIGTMPADHQDMPELLQNHSVALSERFHRLGDLEDLEAAVQGFQRAIDCTPADYPDRSEYLHSLAVALKERYRQLGDVKDLEAARTRSQEAVNLTPADHPNRARYLQVLGESVTDQYLRLEDVTDLEAAVQIDQEAVDFTPMDHPDRPKCLQGLAISLIYRYHRFRNPKDLEEIHNYYTASFSTPIMNRPESSWKAAVTWASFSAHFQPSDVSMAYQAAFDLLPEILWIGNDIPVRHDAIRRLDVGPIAAAAVRTYINLGQLRSAVAILEQGVGTIFQQMLQLEPDVAKLSQMQAAQLQQLSFKLYSGTSSNPREVAAERKNLLDSIRKQQGLEYFLLPTPYSKLCDAAENGPVIILNSHADGSDAIIILNSALEPVHVALPNITIDLLRSQRDTLKDLLSHCGVRTREESDSTRLFGGREEFTSKTTNERFEEMLTWLGSNIVDPVCQALSSHGIFGGRLWWLPTGLFTGLPLHASGSPDKFIHSYTTTLESLLVAQAKKSSITHKFGVVGVTHTSHGGKNYLKGVEQEVKKISSVIKTPGLQSLKGEHATPDAVKLQLQDCSWVHLACHGTQDLMEPTKSRLLLYEGSLELETILRMPLQNAEFVFLAACQTAMGDTDLFNESFHLGGGFIAAGFRSVVGTLWSMNDQDGPLVAETFYSHLFSNGRQPQASDTAEALQLAVRELKARKIPYERWIPFIHMGV